MIEMQRTSAALPRAGAEVRLETTAPSGADLQGSGRGTFASRSVPPPAGLEKDPHMGLFVAALARIAKAAVEQGRVPMLAVGSNGSRNDKGSGQQPDPLRRVGGGDRDTNSPYP
jgi:hypothetical protein